MTRRKGAARKQRKNRKTKDFRIHIYIISAVLIVSLRIGLYHNTISIYYVRTKEKLLHVGQAQTFSAFRPS